MVFLGHHCTERNAQKTSLEIAVFASFENINPPFFLGGGSFTMGISIPYLLQDVFLLQR